MAMQQKGSLVITKDLNVNNDATIGQDLIVSGTMQSSGLSYPTVDGTSSQVITTDGAGNLSLASIDHVDLQNIGANTHPQIDAHLNLLAASGTNNQDNLVSVSGHLQSQLDNIDISGLGDAILGFDGITVVSGSNSIDLTGFRTEFVSASGSLQTQIDNIDVDDPDVASLNGLQGNLIIASAGAVSVTDNGADTVTVSGLPDQDDVDSITVSGTTVTGSVTFEGQGGTWLQTVGNTIVINSDVGGSGSGTITSINTSATGPGVTITGVGSVSTLTAGNVITVSGELNNQSYLHIQSTPATEWVVEHNLNTSYPVWSAYRSSGQGFIPQDVVPSGLNALRVFLDPEESGAIRITVGGGAAGDVGPPGAQGTQGVSGTIGEPGRDGRLTMSLSIEEPSNNEDFSWFVAPVDITIEQVKCVLRGSSSPSVTISIMHNTDRNASGNNILDSSTAITNTTTGQLPSIASGDVTVPSGSFVWLESSAKSGTVLEIFAHIVYSEDQ